MRLHPRRLEDVVTAWALESALQTTSRRQAWHRRLGAAVVSHVTLFGIAAAVISSQDADRRAAFALAGLSLLVGLSGTLAALGAVHIKPATTYATDDRGNVLGIYSVPMNPEQHAAALWTLSVFSVLALVASWGGLFVSAWIVLG